METKELVSPPGQKPEPAAEPRKTLKVRVWRGAEEGSFATYDVPWRENQTVLDVVTEIQRSIEPDLSYRFSCRVGVCGTCAMTVNGKPRWTCRTHVSRVAREKAGAGLLQVAAVDGAVVLGADTEVVLGDEVFGKPADAEAAAAMLRRLSGRTHRVVSTLWCVSAAREEHAQCVSTVEFAPLDEAAIAAYVATGEPFGKAGAYAIQRRAAAFIRRLDGSYSGVMGLPLCETAHLLRRFDAA